MKTEAMPVLLGCESVHEDVSRVLGVDARTVVFDLDAQLVRDRVGAHHGELLLLLDSFESPEEASFCTIWGPIHMVAYPL